MTNLTIGDKALLDREIAKISSKEKEAIASKILKNNKTATGEYYEGAKFETIDFLEDILVKLLENNIPPERAYDVVCALKYLSTRLGSKDDTPYQLDLLKAENYIHRARTGHWLSKNYLKQEEERISESTGTR